MRDNIAKCGRDRLALNDNTSWLMSCAVCRLQNWG